MPANYRWCSARHTFLWLNEVLPKSALFFHRFYLARWLSAHCTVFSTNWPQPTDRVHRPVRIALNKNKLFIYVYSRDAGKFVSWILVANQLTRAKSIEKKSDEQKLTKNYFSISSQKISDYCEHWTLSEWRWSTRRNLSPLKSNTISSTNWKELICLL